MQNRKDVIKNVSFVDMQLLYNINRIQIYKYWSKYRNIEVPPSLCIYFVVIF